ncbi:hypothetical protein [Paraburkholderia dilworthii]|uniref:hypothetical protein n=1 Tax=Paraburkholderia dilworthii TaxID=948106 RepID=UPI00047F0EF6|nr:hypothetical protein [Paraburkholderia dilworthii]
MRETQVDANFAGYLCFTLTASSHSNETWYLPDGSFETVAVVTLAPFGIVRDHRIASGAAIFASVNDAPSHLKALVVYSADCTPSLRLKFGYLARFAKKFANADCKWRKACCTGTELTSFNHACWGVLLSAVSAAEVS